MPLPRLAFPHLLPLRPPSNPSTSWPRLLSLLPTCARRRTPRRLLHLGLEHIPHAHLVLLFPLDRLLQLVEVGLDERDFGGVKGLGLGAGLDGGRTSMSVAICGDGYDTPAARLGRASAKARA